jgi:DNA-binding NtrC family response regulator
VRNHFLRISVTIWPSLDALFFYPKPQFIKLKRYTYIKFDIQMPENKKILIIDDEIDLCLLLKEYFVQKKYDVVLAHTLNEGRMLLNTTHPNILFLDNNLPDGTGWGSAPLIAADYPDLYIILISAFHPSIPSMPVNARYQTFEKPIGFADLDKEFANF